MVLRRQGLAARVAGAVEGEGVRPPVAVGGVRTAAVDDVGSEDDRVAGLHRDRGGRPVVEAALQPDAEGLRGDAVDRQQAAAVRPVDHAQAAVAEVGPVDVEHAVDLRRQQGFELPVLEVLVPGGEGALARGLHHQLGMEEVDVGADELAHDRQHRLAAADGVDGRAHPLRVHELAHAARPRRVGRLLPRDMHARALGGAVGGHALVQAFAFLLQPGDGRGVRQAADHDPAAAVEARELLGVQAGSAAGGRDDGKLRRSDQRERRIGRQRSEGGDGRGGAEGGAHARHGVRAGRAAPWR